MPHNRLKKGENKTRDQSDSTDRATRETENRFLRVPKPGSNHGSQMIIFENHINWLELKIKKEFGDISCLVKGEDPAPIVDPVPVGTPIPQPHYQPPQTPRATPIGVPVTGPAAGTRGSASSSTTSQPVTLMTQARHNKEAEDAVEERKERKKDISKALGVILETIDDSFRIYRESNQEAKMAYRNNDIKTIMSHIAIWYRSHLGSAAEEVIATSEADLKRAKDTFDQIRQFKTQSVSDFKKTFDAHVNIYQRTTGEILTESRKAYRFLDKLFKPKFGDWFTQMERYDRKFTLIKAHNPNVIKDETKGIPNNLALAYSIASAQENELAKQERKEASKRSREE